MDRLPRVMVRTYLMKTPIILAKLVPALAILSCANVHAEIFKCTDDAGEVTYSQTPCAKDHKIVNVMGVESTPKVESTACRYANRFALETARGMKQGTRSDEIFDQYGGLDSLSKGTIGIINYVYRFRTSEDVSAERIAALTETSCKAESLGDVSCEKLPIAFTDTLGGCGNDELAEAPDQSAPAQATTAPGAGLVAVPDDAAVSKTAAEPTLAPEDARIQCIERYREQMDNINEQMRSGYSSEQGDAFRERLRELRHSMAAC